MSNIKRLFVPFKKLFELKFLGEEKHYLLNALHSEVDCNANFDTQLTKKQCKQVVLKAKLLRHRELYKGTKTSVRV